MNRVVFVILVAATVAAGCDGGQTAGSPGTAGEGGAGGTWVASSAGSGGTTGPTGLPACPSTASLFTQCSNGALVGCVDDHSLRMNNCRAEMSPKTPIGYLPGTFSCVSSCPTNGFSDCKAMAVSYVAKCSYPAATGPFGGADGDYVTGCTGLTAYDQPSVSVTNCNGNNGNQGSAFESFVCFDKCPASGYSP